MSTSCQHVEAIMMARAQLESVMQCCMIVLYMRDRIQRMELC